MTDDPESDDEDFGTVAPPEKVKPAKPTKRSGLAVGAAAVGIGSAAVVAALLYVRHRKRGRASDA